MGCGSMDGAWVALLLSLVVVIGTCQLIDRKDGLCELLVKPYGPYECQEYQVQTGDGFMLGVQRMWKKQFVIEGLRKGPVFLLHGLSLDGDVWVLGRSNSLGFALADRGYDVWIGNTRTTSFSLGHVSFTKDDKQFWDWSVDDLAEQDVPAFLNLVYGITKRKMLYVGYSQGSQQLLAAYASPDGSASRECSTKMIEKMVMMAPVFYVTNISAPLFETFIKINADKIAMATNVFKFSTQTPFGKQLVDVACRSNLPCYKAYTYIFSGDSCCLDYSRRDLFDKYETQTTAVKNLAHLAQQSRGDNFAKFDYGMEGNLEHYGSSNPPIYDESRIPTDNLFLIHGGKDQLADLSDVKRFKKYLTNKTNSILHNGPKISYIPNYGHLDFILAKNALSTVYNEVISFFES